MALRIVRPVFTPVVAAAIFLSLLGACTLPTNVALKHVDSLREAETNCLMANVARLNVADIAREQVAQDAAASCRDRTEQLAAYAVPHVSPQERQAFEEDAVRRASGYVAQTRNNVADR